MIANANTPWYKSALEYTILSLIGLFMLSAPYQWHFSSYLIAGIGGGALVYGLCFGSVTVFKDPQWRRYARCFVPMICLYALALVGMLYTSSPKAGAVLEKNLSFIVFPAIFLLLGPGFFTLKRLKALGIVFYAACVLIIVVFGVVLAGAVHHPGLQTAYEEHRWLDLLNLFSQLPHSYIDNPHARDFIVHHTFQALYMLMAMSMIVYTWAVHPEWYRAWYKKAINILLMLFFLVFGIFLGFSKMGYLTFCLWCIPTLGFLIYKRLSVISAVGIVAVLIGSFALLFVLFPQKMQRVTITYRSAVTHVFHREFEETLPKEGSVLPRLLLWQESVEAIKEKPLFGWGTGAERERLHPAQYGLDKLQGDPHPHNQWLLYGIRFGLVGILALGWLFFVGFKFAYRTRNGLLAMLMFLTFCFSLTDRNLDWKIGIIFFGLMYGLLVAFSQYTAPSDKPVNQGL